MANPFFTIGHSTRPIETFTALLIAAEVKLVVDVRTVPRSRFNPQFNRDALPASLTARGIAYEHLAPLGGLRGTQRDIPPETNAFWENASFHNYADYAMSQEFRSGLRTLREWGETAPACVMCAESLWWRCHRRIITDYLLADGVTVRHIMAHDKIEAATLTPGAELRVGGRIAYPAAQGTLI